MRVQALLLSSLLFVAPSHLSAQAQLGTAADTGRSVVFASGVARQAATLDRASVVLLLETQGMSIEDASTRLAAIDRAVQDTLRRFNLPAGTVHSYVGGVVPFRPQAMTSSMMSGPSYSGRSTIRIDRSASTRSAR